MLKNKNVTHFSVYIGVKKMFDHLTSIIVTPTIVYVMVSWQACNRQLPNVVFDECSPTAIGAFNFQQRI